MKIGFIDKVDNFICENELLSLGDRVIVGVSGGADSVALFTTLVRLRVKYNLALKVVHVHHGLRKEADEEAEYVETLCNENNIEFVCKRYDCLEESRRRGLGLEETGRIIRYEAFNEEVQDDAKIAIAHNLNDRAETMLFHLCRGTGPRGLSAIKAVSGNRIRPLLCVSRAEIEEFLLQEGIRFYTDASNKEDSFTRNRIRNKVFPILTSEVNSESIRHIATASYLLEQQNDFIYELAAEKMKEIVIASDKSHFQINKEGFLSLHLTLQREIVKQAIDSLVVNNKDITLVHIQSVIELLEKEGNKKLDLPYSLEIISGYNDFLIGLKGFKSKSDVSAIALREGEFEIDGLGRCKVTVFDRNEGFVLCQKEYTKFFDYDKINSRLELRTRRSGDYLTVNSSMGTKKLKDYFIDIKLDAQKREEALLVADDSHVLWVVGHRISEYYKVSNETKKILSIEIMLED